MTLQAILDGEHMLQLCSKKRGCILEEYTRLAIMLGAQSLDEAKLLLLFVRYICRVLYSAPINHVIFHVKPMAESPGDLTEYLNLPISCEVGT